MNDTMLYVLGFFEVAASYFDVKLLHGPVLWNSANISSIFFIAQDTNVHLHPCFHSLQDFRPDFSPFVFVYK